MPTSSPMMISRSTAMAIWIGLIALAKVFGLGLITDLILMMTSTYFLLKLVRHGHFDQSQAIPITLIFILFIFYAALTAFNPSFTGLKNTLGLVIGLSFYVFGMMAAKQFTQTAGPWRVLLFFSILCVVLGEIWGTANKNTISGLAIYLLLSAGALIAARNPNRKSPTLLVLLGVIILTALMGHRMGAVAGLVALFSFWIFWVFPFKSVRKFLLISTASVILLLVAFYIGLWGLDVRDLNELLVSISGRNAVSGRQIIWPLIVAEVSIKPLFGLGTGVTFSNLYESDWSAHSLFLQVYMQTGLIGLLLLCAIFLALWYPVGPPIAKNSVSAYTAAILIVLLLHSSTEVFLTQVNLVIGALAWLTCGFCTSLCIHARMERQAQPSVQKTPFRSIASQ